MKAAKRWLLATPAKVPFYIDGTPRSGALDSPDDQSRLGSYDDAKAALAHHPGWLLGFALGPDGTGWHWQGIDFDHVEQNFLGTEANEAPGYVELSPSDKGAHAIGYGRHFATLGPNGSGVEAYAAGRYFTVTERPIRFGQLACLADFVTQRIAPRHGVRRAAAANDVELVPVDDRKKAELRSALASIRSDERDLWVRMGHALKELGEPGRALWLEWSQSSDKYDPRDAAKRWESFNPRDTGHQAVFAEAKRQGWLNPASNAAQLAPAAAAPAKPSSITLEFAMSTDRATVRLDYLVDPFLPRRCVVGFYGRGASSKSSYIASLAAHVSKQASTLWVSVEEPADWIKVRHIGSGGAENTLAVVTAVAAKRDHHGRVVASSFNIYEHLEPAILQAQAAIEARGSPPLGLVNLDTAVGLTSWAKGETPNDDGSVKRLLAYLQSLAERYNLTIAIIGHANKGKPDHISDIVMGATAWTNSPRLSFVHAADRRAEYSYVMRVAKTNLVTFGMSYTTQPVHVLYERKDGPELGALQSRSWSHRLGRSCLNGDVGRGHQEAERR